MMPTKVGGCSSFVVSFVVVRPATFAVVVAAAVGAASSSSVLAVRASFSCAPAPLIWQVMSASATETGCTLVTEPVAGGAQETIEADVVLVSTGRVPHTAGASSLSPPLLPPAASAAAAAAPAAATAPASFALLALLLVTDLLVLMRPPFPSLP